MRIDFATLAFGYVVKVGGGTPNWATSLGQGKDYKINEDPDIDELLKGMVYTSVSLSKVTSKIGKGGKTMSGNAEESPIIVASCFPRVYINDELIYDTKYVMLITRDTSASHAGRLRFKYGPSNTYLDDNKLYSNETFWEQAKKQLGLEEDACFFVYDISVENQNELRLATIIVDPKKKVEYIDSTDLHAHWDDLIEEDEKKYGRKVHKQLTQQEVEQVSSLFENETGAEINHTEMKNCLDIVRGPRTTKVHPLNFIVYGAPGTGKTYSMVEYALAIIDNISIGAFRAANTDRKANVTRYKSLVKAGQVVFTTFHQNYGYEEFIQGLRPDKDSDTMAFKTVDGVFKVIADTALNDTEGKNYVIVIDEINRANISKVFGELITLIEEDKRWGELNETSATLQSGDPFAVPNNLYIVGTMNSADKSISLIDAALRRRFDFIEQKPDSSLVADPVLKTILETINLSLVEELDSTDLLVGHSYFMNKKQSDLCNILNNNIIPLLYEYFYDNRKKVASILSEAIKKAGASVEIVDEKVGRLRVKEV